MLNQKDLSQVTDFQKSMNRIYKILDSIHEILRRQKIEWYIREAKKDFCSDKSVVLGTNDDLKAYFESV